MSSVPTVAAAAARRSKAILWTLVAAVVLAGATVLSYGLMKEREEAIRHAEELTANAASFVEGHAVRVLESTDALVRRVVANVADADPATWREDGALWSRIKGLADALPELGFIWIADANGVVALTSSRFPTPHFPVADREYFLAHFRDGKDFYIGPAFKGRGSGDFYFTVSRSIRDGAGNLIGIAVAAIDTIRFLDFQRYFGLGTNTFGILRDDGAALVRQPHREDFYGQVFTEFIQLAGGREQGTLDRLSKVDGVRRIIAFRRASNLPIVVNVSASYEAVLTEWRQNVRRAAGLSAVALMPVLLAALLAWRSGRREETALTQLRRSHEQLEQKVTQRTTALTRALHQAEAATVAKSRFIAAASHDLRQPMQALRLYLDVLDGMVLETKPRQAVRQASEAMRATEQLLGALLDISRLEAGMIEPAHEAVALRNVTDALASEAAPQAAGKGLRFRYRRPGPDMMAVSDAVLLQRIVRNLLVNALRYTTTGGILLACRRRRGMLCIEVWDTGRGIPAERLEQIFQEYYQLDDHGDRVQGLGLGLSIVQRTAELLGHAVTVRSQVGRGSLFAISVPAAKVEAKAEAVG